jgi:DNA-binding transcriptional ArsR family regulator
MAADMLTRVFSALADPTRRDIVARLAEGDATAGQLAEPYRMTLQAVYKHLRVLEDAGLASGMEIGVNDGYATLRRMVDDGAV